MKELFIKDNVICVKKILFLFTPLIQITKYIVIIVDGAMNGIRKVMQWIMI